MANQFLPLDWTTYHAYAVKLAATILSTNIVIDEIVAISRGGLAFGHVLSDLLRVPIWTISIQSYTDIQNQGEIKIKGKLQNPIENRHILLVDDVADSGKTLVRAIEYLKEGNPKKITTMTLFYKPQSIFRPDYFAKQTSKWILFPTEVTETIVYISDKLTKEGKSKRDIQLFLEDLHYSPAQIAFVRKHHIYNQRTSTYKKSKQKRILVQ